MTAAHDLRERQEARRLLFAARDAFATQRTEIVAIVHRSLLAAARGERCPLRPMRERDDALRPGTGATVTAVDDALTSARVGCSRPVIVEARERAVEMLRNGGVWWAS